ncbi:hypothetical protein LIER_21369 [Lithospermum erythrorhizon]|uniref:Amino acid transporter transmembrane domain-containing protein n=1 Tax=Lithospermum erythrorhizon TaxID=34254 RepID=A0AAV3QU43_LITER
MAVEGEDHLSLLPQMTSDASNIVTPDSLFIKTGTTWTALAHIITAAIGSGVLTLAWSVSRLGWVAAPFIFLVFASVSYVSARLLSNCYKSPDPDSGPSTNGSYIEAARVILGKKNAMVSGIILQLGFVKTGIVYTIATASSLRAIQQSNCYHYQGHDATCNYRTEDYMLVFGVLQVFLSQIPNFRNTEWLSIVAAVMSFAYSTIGSALGLAKVIENGEVKGSLGGVPTSTAAEKVWSISISLGDIAFAFPFSTIFLEIQDTMAPPSEKRTMQKASTFAVCIITFFYMCCGGFGYAAFGNSTPGNILTGFGFYEPYWLVDFANACVVLHLIGAYQVFSQTLFGNAERWLVQKYPTNRLLHDFHTLKLPVVPAIRLNMMRLCFRTVYVCFTTGVAMIFPYFNQVVAVAGAVSFWPLVVYFPVEMYLVQKKISPWTTKWIVLRSFTVICFFIMAFAFVGSVKELIAARFS